MKFWDFYKNFWLATAINVVVFLLLGAVLSPLASAFRPPMPAPELLQPPGRPVAPVRKR